jgi:hypothetical protein
MELTMEEMDQELVEYLPPREVMCSPCRPCYNPCEPRFDVDVSISLCVNICL